MRESPGTTPQKTLRHVKDIYRNHGRYKVTTEEKSTSDQRTPWEKLPERVGKNDQEAEATEATREKEGRILPTAHFVCGGKVSPK